MTRGTRGLPRYSPGVTVGLYRGYQLVNWPDPDGTSFLRAGSPAYVGSARQSSEANACALSRSGPCPHGSACCGRHPQRPSVGDWHFRTDSRSGARAAEWGRDGTGADEDPRRRRTRRMASAWPALEEAHSVPGDIPLPYGSWHCVSKWRCRSPTRRVTDRDSACARCYTTADVSIRNSSTGVGARSVRGSTGWGHPEGGTRWSGPKGYLRVPA